MRFSQEGDRSVLGAQAGNSIEEVLLGLSLKINYMGFCHVNRNIGTGGVMGQSPEA